MTTAEKQKYPWQLFVITALLVLLALRDYLGKYALYFRFQEAGIPAGAMWSFSSDRRR